MAENKKKTLKLRENTQISIKQVSNWDNIRVKDCNIEFKRNEILISRPTNRRNETNQRNK